MVSHLVFAAAAVFSILHSAEGHSPQTCPRDELLRDDLTSPIDGIPMQLAATRLPWTHVPYCFRPEQRNTTEYCVVTNGAFHNGRGISVVTRRDIALRLLEQSTVGTVKHVVRALRREKYEAVQTEDRGTGLFVKEGETIAPGEVVFVDYPTLAVVREAIEIFTPEERQKAQWMGLLQLPEPGRRLTRELAKSKGLFYDEVDNLMTTNALGQTFGQSRHLALYPEAAKVNHGCIPNTYYRFNETTLEIELFAIREIKGGEELVYSYLDPFQERLYGDRHTLLGSQWAFECSCSVCGMERGDSDRRRKKMTRVKNALAESVGDPAKILENCRDLLALYDDEGIIIPKARYYEIAAYAANQLGEDEEAGGLASKARDWWLIIAGDESWEVKRMEDFLKDPRKHPSYQPRLPRAEKEG